MFYKLFCKITLFVVITLVGFCHCVFYLFRFSVLEGFWILCLHCLTYTPDCWVIGNARLSAQELRFLLFCFSYAIKRWLHSVETHVRILWAILRVRAARHLFTFQSNVGGVTSVTWGLAAVLGNVNLQLGFVAEAALILFACSILIWLPLVYLWIKTWKPW